MTERPGDVTHKGKPLTVLGAKLKPGDKAPDFELADALFSTDTVTLADTGREGPAVQRGNFFIIYLMCRR